MSGTRIARGVAVLLLSMSVAWQGTAESPEVLYTQGMQAARQGDYRQALRYLRRAADERPTSSKVYIGLGTVYLHLGEYGASEAAFKAALSITPGALSAEANLAALYTKTGRTEEAIGLYRSLVRQHPTALQVRVGLASAYQQAERFEAAIAAYHESLRLAPTLAPAMANLASCYEAVENGDEAVRYYTAALAVAPRLPMANGNLGAIYQKRGELEKAFPLLETAVREDPQFTAARYCLGLVYTKRREYRRAATEYRQVIAQQRDHIGAYYNLAQALFRLKEPIAGKQAMGVYRRLTEIAEEIDTRERATLVEPSNPLKQHQLGLVYAKHGKLDKAIEAFQAAVRLDGDAHYALNALARLYTLRGEQLPEAIRFAEKAFRLANAPQYLQTLALAHLQIGDREAALKAIQTALEMDPEVEGFRKTLTYIENIENGTETQVKTEAEGSTEGNDEKTD